LRELAFFFTKDFLGRSFGWEGLSGGRDRTVHGCIATTEKLARAPLEISQNGATYKVPADGNEGV